MNIFLTRMAVMAGMCLVLATLVSCASKEAVNLKIHTDPEGSHIVYRVVDQGMDQDAQWIYLGLTPYQGLTLFDSDAFDDESTISFKVMRYGYLDQVREWNGEQFWAEYEKENILFWAPHLVKAGK
jgi:hypothetical protein